MDAKDLRTESAVSERNNDGSKYSQSSRIALQCDRNKSYQDIGSNSLGKVDVPNGRPCAVIGPDRVVPPPAASEAYHIKKGLAEPWPCMDNGYRRPPEYPHKLTNFQNPSRNISPRQTFQENMQRIMVPPTYNSIKINDDTNYAPISDRSNGLSKNVKTMPQEAQFCDVTYAVNPSNNEQKSIRNPEMCLPSVNPTLTRTAPHGWPPGSVNLRSSRMYGAPEVYQHQEYPSCAGPRPIVSRPHRTIPEEQGFMYADPYYQEGNIRFKPYPNVKERYPQQRYEYIGNYSNPFHPPPGFPSHKYELQKSMPPHPYSSYPPIKYLDSRVAEPVMEGYHRNPQANYSIPYRNQVIHPNYGQVLGNCPQNKMHSYPPDAQLKTTAPNKLPYDNNTKAYIEYDNNRTKIYPSTDSYFVNEMARMPMKGQVVMPNYPTLNMHNIPPNSYYKKDSQQIKNYEHLAHFRNMDPNLNLHMSRPPIFSPNTLAISPTDSSTSNDTIQTLGTSQEDCGYISQSSTASIRSMDSGINRVPNDCIRRYYDNRYGSIVRTSPMMTKSYLNSNNNISKHKKHTDVRQFLQMWNEGDDEADENCTKEIIIQGSSCDKNNFGKALEAMNNHEQLYVLGLVNVPSEELAKYEHIQKVSKLPENIKGYNSIELLNQFEEVIESSNMNNYKTVTPKEFQMSMKGIGPKQTTSLIPPRPVSPLDVEAKISQSVIHKEVGCNFEIKPCSPKMLNVEVASPVQNILGERAIEKVANTVMMKSPMLNGMGENIDCNIIKRPDHQMNINENLRIPSCKMINTQFSNNNTIDPIKSSYSLQDLESNSGLCLASLPRLDNDIELNFPEVNQQFINANKGETAVLTTSLRGLPCLEVLDQSENQAHKKLDSINPSEQKNNVNKSPYSVDSEKEFSKLSKYRKIKTNTTEPKENQTQHNVSAVRTDSVIIKNPENPKKYEECSDYSSKSLIKAVTDIQQAPINLTSQGNPLSNTAAEAINVMVICDADKEKHLPVEIAIDFSFNKNEVLTEYTETRTESKKETLKHIEENPLNTIKDDPSILPLFSEQNENLTNAVNINKNYCSDCEKDTECTPECIIKIDKDSEKMDINKSCDDICTDTVSKKHKGSSDVDNVEEVTIGVSGKSIISPTNTEIPAGKNLSVDTGDNCLMEVNKHNDTKVEEILEKANFTFSKTDLEIPQNVKEDLQENSCVEDAPVKNITNVATVEEFHGIPEVKESMVTEQIHPQNERQPEKMRGTGCDDSPQSKNVSNSEPQPISNDSMTDIINNKIDSTTKLLELSDHERKFKDFEENVCVDNPKMNSHDNSDACCVKSPNECVKEDCKKPIRRYLWYGSKEIYSPWIQKLLMFTEGYDNIMTTKNEVKISDDNLLDATELVNIPTKNEVSDDYDCLLDTTKIVTLDEVSCKNIENSLRKENADEIETTAEPSLKEIETIVCDTPICENNIGDTVNIYNLDTPEINTNKIINEKYIPTVHVDNNINTADNSNNSRELHKNDEIKTNLESEQDNINLDTPIGSQIINDFASNIEDQCEETDTSSFLEDAFCEYQEVSDRCDEKTKDIQLDSSALFENVGISCNKIQENKIPYKKKLPLKRSLSDSALNIYNNDEQSKKENDDDVQFIWPFKRKKVNNAENDLLAQNLCNIIHNNRRNSISSIYNEENVSFCILIDNNCIITEEENVGHEKMGYTELSTDCLAEIQNKCIKHDQNTDTLTEGISSPVKEIACNYSDSLVLEGEQEKSLEDSWVEDVGCVETVIGDDVAEDVEINGQSSPKDDGLSDNDESGIFSTNEHTDKVKYIYGGKMCNDDAQFVDTLYKTPQMDVNKTLFNRETRVSEEYDKYYDNDSLEKMLSASNEQELSHYVPEYSDSIFPSRVVDHKVVAENKENFNEIETFSPFQSNGNGLDIVVDINVDKINQEDIHSIDFFAKAGDDTLHSFESSLDNVYTYKQKDEDIIYTTSSSPEVSSTTSEEKNSAILLKITNYKGSRISQINDISRITERPSCKFTEDNEYLQSCTNFPTNRPLLTKAAQKYIPPLKESIRDLKVKLSLPQHSLIKLKQLKISKDEPKVNKQNATAPRIPRKPKPKFEDVLKSIDEIQFKMHKEKTKKSKKSIPKVVIKKNENGSHYASTSNKEDYNPDLTGRKWQPWVFIEKNHFIDKMAIKNKTKAIYSHRKKTYVLAEKFQKYRSASSGKFVISPPISDNPASGLKYTIRLKHNY